MYKVVIFTGGEAPEVFKGNHWLNSSSNDCVIAADSGFENCLAFDKVPNLVIGDFDSTSQKKVEEFFTNDLSKDFRDEDGEDLFLPKTDYKILSWPKDKDYTDTELALMEAKNYVAAQCASNCFNTKTKLFTILVGGDGGRLDHLFGILNLYKTENYPNVWLGKEQGIICLDSNTDFHTLEISNLQKDSVISVFPVFSQNLEKSKYQVESENLKWDLSLVNWEENQLSLSNRLENPETKTCKISAKTGRFIVFVPLYALVNIDKYKTKL